MNISDLTRDEIIEQLSSLEIEFSSKSATETLRKALAKEINGDDDQEEPAGKSGGKFIEINFAKDKDDKQPVYVGVNGKSYRFKRGEWVKCPRHLLPTIENIQTSSMDDDTKEIITMPTYPYQVREVA